MRKSKLEQRYIEREIEHESTSIEETYRDRNTLHIIERALYDLPPKCRQAFYMHRSRGYTYPEIARQLDVSTSMVEKYITQALNHFRNKLS